MGRNHIDARLGAQCYLAIMTLKRGPFWGYLGPHLDPLLEGYMGPNHIDARLGLQCHYGVLGHIGVPHSGGTPGDGVSGPPSPAAAAAAAGDGGKEQQQPKQYHYCLGYYYCENGWHYITYAYLGSSSWYTWA